MHESPKFINTKIAKKGESGAKKVMDNKDFVTKNELETFEKSIDLKIQVAIQPLEGKIDKLGAQIDGKFNTLEQKIEYMFLKQKQEIQKERQENIKWIVGTAIALAAALWTIL